MNELATATAVAANLENNHSYELQYHCAAMVLNIKTLEHGKYLRNSATSCSTECSLAAEWLHFKVSYEKTRAIMQDSAWALPATPWLEKLLTTYNYDTQSHPWGW